MEPIDKSIDHQFDELWRANAEISLQDFVKDCASYFATEQLVRLVEIDIRNRMRIGNLLQVESYFIDFPQLEPHRAYLSDFDHGVRRDHSQKSTDPNTLDETISIPLPSKSHSLNFFSNSSGLPTEPDSPISIPSRKPTNFVPQSKYRLDGKLGSGSFGTVYRAYDQTLNRNVAIKVKEGTVKQANGLPEDFLHEARSIARLDHPAIVRLLSNEQTDDGQGYLVYEFVDGATLLDRIKQQDYSIPQLVAWIADIAEALDAAHRLGIIHRDVSPRNIMIDKNDRARLLDFGLSRRDGKFFLNDSGAVLGTPHFMSPEQAAGKPHWANSHADLFSLGSVLYYALTEQLPFAAEKREEIIERVRFSTPAPPRSIKANISVDLEAICMKALNKEPSLRYHTGRDFSKELRQSLIDETHFEISSTNQGIDARSLIQVATPKNSLHLTFQYLLGLFLIVAGSVVLLQQSGLQLFPGSSRSDSTPLDQSAPNTKPLFTKVNFHAVDKDGTVKQLSDQTLPLALDYELQVTWSLNTPAYVTVFEFDGENKGVSLHTSILKKNSYFSIRNKHQTPGCRFILLCIQKDKSAAESIQTVLTKAPFNTLIPIDSASKWTNAIASYSDEAESESPVNSLLRSGGTESSNDVSSIRDIKISKEFKDFLATNYSGFYGIVIGVSPHK